MDWRRRYAHGLQLLAGYAKMPLDASKDGRLSFIGAYCNPGFWDHGLFQS